jgi:hypothetical protein
MPLLLLALGMGMDKVCRAVGEDVVVVVLLCCRFVIAVVIFVFSHFPPELMNGRA